jgi:Spy/CpxP family protein refolding chaperone
MNRSLKVVLAAVLAFAASAGAVRAAEGKGEHKDGAEKHEKMFGRMKEKLGLSNEQADKFKAAFKAQREAVKPLREQIKVGLEKLRWQVDAKADSKDIAATLEQIDRSKKAMRAEREKLQATVTALLSPEARARMALWQAKRMHKHGRGGHGGWGKHEKGGKGHGEGRDKGHGDHDEDESKE